MLINLSNHPSDKWDKKQTTEANNKFGTIVDITFPAIDPKGDKTYIVKIATKFFNKIAAVFDECANNPKDNAVHLQGEFTFVFNLATLLKASGIKCLASTTKRDVEELENGKKVVKFKFVQFREY